MKQTYFFIIAVMVITFTQAQIVDIPDANFKNALVNTNSADFDGDGTVDGDVDTNNDGEIQIEEAEIVLGLNVSNNNISDLTGIHNFTNLIDLKCYNNELIGLNLEGNASLLYLQANENDFTTINLSQNVNLEYLSLSFMNINEIDLSSNISLETLVMQYANLEHLDVSENFNLKYLDCTNNNLESLDVSQNTSLEVLLCNNNALNNLNFGANSSLEAIRCNDNFLTSINISQCSGLTNLRCYDNQLSELNVSNNTLLEHLDFDNNSINSIDLSSNLNLNKIYAKRNLLTNLDLSNNMNLVRVDVRFNVFLEYINLKNSSNNTLTSFSAQECPNLNFICVDNVSYATNNFTNVNPFSTFIDDCSLIGTPNRITGTVTYDINNDGCDVSDVFANNLMIQSSDGTTNFSTSTGSIGEYSINVLENTYDTRLVGIPDYFQVSPNPETTIFTDFNNTENVDFCITSSQTVNDVNVLLLPVTQARPGFDSNYQLVFENMGTTILNGTIELNFDELYQTFVSANPTETSLTSTSLTFEYTNLQPFEVRTIDFVMNTFPPTTVDDGDILNFSATINPVSGDLNPDDNVFNLEQTVVNSFDPNDKQVLQGIEITLLEASEYLDYIIRFQNTGSASAVNIVITDKLSNKLDWNTMRPISSSHSYRIEMVNGFTQFIFENIYLPAQQDDDSGSNGFIAFKIKPMNTANIGDIINGNAKIYFDYNAPIITNFVSTEIVETLSIEEIEIQSTVEIYPNPTTDFVHVKSVNPIESVVVYDIHGREIQAVYVTGSSNNTKISLLNHANGVYFLNIKTTVGVQTSKIIKE